MTFRKKVTWYKCCDLIGFEDFAIPQSRMITVTSSKIDPIQLSIVSILTFSNQMRSLTFQQNWSRLDQYKIYVHCKILAGNLNLHASNLNRTKYLTIFFIASYLVQFSTQFVYLFRITSEQTRWFVICNYSCSIFCQRNIKFGLFYL